MGLKNLSSQLFDRSNFLPAVIQDMLTDHGSFRPLILDLRPNLPEQVRVRSGLIGLHDDICVYQQP